MICTRDRPEQLDACILAVLAQTYPCFDVLVVDNASRDARTARVAARHGVRYVSEPRMGLSVARNRGAREAATADVVAYVDDDAVPEAGWLNALCAEFADPRVMAVTGRVLPLRLDTEGARMCIAMGIHDGGPRRIVVHRDQPGWFDALRAGVGTGANMAIRRTAFSTWPGFDPRLGLGAILEGGEEDDAFLTLIVSGYAVVYTPSAVVRHAFADTAPDLTRQHLDGLAASVGYLALVFAERPDLRATVLAHVVRRLPRGRRRTFSRDAAQAARLAPVWREVWAGVRGMALYVRSARVHRRRHAVLESAVAPARLALGPPQAGRRD